MANLGNVGHNIALARFTGTAWHFYTQDKQPTSVTMHSVSDIPFAFAILTRNAVTNDRTRCDSSGNWFFYDMDNSGGQIYSIATYTQDGATGEAWTATVVGNVVVVIKTFAANRAAAAAFT